MNDEMDYMNNFTFDFKVGLDLTLFCVGGSEIMCSIFEVKKYI